jgi:hypothetical protein
MLRTHVRAFAVVGDPWKPPPQTITPALARAASLLLAQKSLDHISNGGYIINPVDMTPIAGDFMIFN